MARRVLERLVGPLLVERVDLVDRPESVLGVLPERDEALVPADVVTEAVGVELETVFAVFTVLGAVAGATGARPHVLQ
jgi:hypothetical protein